MLWNELCTAWQSCFSEAWTAYTEGSRPIGACITDQSGNVLATGRNRMATTTLEMPYLNSSRLAHAEMNAMLYLASRMQNELECAKLEVRDLILWTTTEPCPLCIGASVMMNLRELKYASRERWAGSLEILNANPYLQSKKIVVHHPENLEFEIILVLLHAELGLRQETPQLLECWAEDTPRAIALAQELSQNGTLEQLRKTVTDAREAMNTLELIANR